MKRDVGLPEVDYTDYTVSREHGGTGVHDIMLAAEALGLVSVDQRNQPNGFAGLDIYGKVLPSVLPEGFGAKSVNLSGNFRLSPNTSYIFTITDFDSFKPYIVSSASGTISRIGDTITLVTGAALGSSSFVVNSRTFDFTTELPTPLKPVITSPVATSVLLTTSYSFTSNAFTPFGDNATHENTDWQIATDGSFSTSVFSSIGDTVNKVSWAVAGLVDGTTYFVRTRYKASNGNYSPWSNAVTFSIAVPTPIAPTVTSPTNNATGVQTAPNLTSSAFGALGDNSTHASSDWELSLVSDFSTILFQVSSSVENKTSWTPTGLTMTTDHYVRVRHRSTNGKVSNWSPIVKFTTISNQVINVTVAADTYNFNMKAAAIAAGWNQTIPLSLTVTINGGVVIGSGNTAVVAFDTGSGFPNGSVLTLNNYGYIVGMGGEGGRGGGDGGGGGAGTAGYAGGHALNAEYPLSVTNNGTIGGGGGGGGGAGPFVYGVFGYGQGNGTTYRGVCGGGGGGGAGRSAGQPGRDGDGDGTWLDVNGGNTFTAGAGSLTAGGGGGAGQLSNYGGGGGALGQPGAPSNGGSIAYYAGSEDGPGNTAGGPSAINPGGAAGYASVNSSNITWLTLGDVRGSRV